LKIYKNVCCPVRFNVGPVKKSNVTFKISFPCVLLFHKTSNPLFCMIFPPILGKEVICKTLPLLGSATILKYLLSASDGTKAGLESVYQPPCPGVCPVKSVFILPRVRLSKFSLHSTCADVNCTVNKTVEIKNIFVFIVLFFN